MVGVDHLGDDLAESVASAKTEVVLCAPFSKLSTLDRILRSIGTNVELKLITRWRLEEIAAGVSDTGVLRRVEEVGGRVFLCDRLHAKYFRVDERVYLGSANLTASALGWTGNPNLEILVELPASECWAADFEARLTAESVLATQSMADEVDRLAELFPRAEVPDVVSSQQDSRVWSPGLREPKDLYTAYSRGADRLSSISADQARDDLGVLDVPNGYTRDQFQSLVAGRLLVLPIPAMIDQFLTRPQRFGAVRDRLSEIMGISREEASHRWQTLMRWYLEFLPSRYERSVPNVSELFGRSERRESIDGN